MTIWNPAIYYFVTYTVNHQTSIKFGMSIAKRAKGKHKEPELERAYIKRFSLPFCFECVYFYIKKGLDLRYFPFSQKFSRIFLAFCRPRVWVLFLSCFPSVRTRLCLYFVRIFFAILFSPFFHPSLQVTAATFSSWSHGSNALDVPRSPLSFKTLFQLEKEMLKELKMLKGKWQSTIWLR